MRVIIVVIALILSSCSRHQPAPIRDARYQTPKSGKSTSKQTPYKSKFITVDKGDTLYSIGFSYGVDHVYLAQINNIPSPFRIYPGQVLRLTSNQAQTNNASLKTQAVKINQPLNGKTNKVAYSKPKVKTTTKPVIKRTKQPLKKAQSITKHKVTPPADAKWIWPVKGKIISTFSTSDETRKGIDIASKIGGFVYASNNGTVVYSGDGLLGYGELIIVKHSNNLLSAYAHNSSRLVKEGVNVKKGQKIAKSGKGSNGKGLLHFEIRKNGQPVNPMKYLSKN